MHLRKRRTVYPRWRGEHSIANAGNQPGDGLSPLARGTPDLLIIALGVMRFIPAGAGNTDYFQRQAFERAVYPRWRGEHIEHCGAAGGNYGLSPLARGTRMLSVVMPFSARFIPAGAGNTPRQASYAVVEAVYPRWRGEHKLFLIRPTIIDGLSPLARGTLAARTTDRIPARFIPAGAGNTAGVGSRGYHGPVYPRWRGEHMLSAGAMYFDDGLSPLARGTRCRIHPRGQVQRFIPAGAGNTIPEKK
ncbi:hypothetical protein AZ034_004664 [Pluralibacter gergoviae]|nr:hypothetical protein AZ034_004664 [Pluralibacter gergoviae]